MDAVTRARILHLLDELRRRGVPDEAMGRLYQWLDDQKLEHLQNWAGHSWTLYADPRRSSGQVLRCARCQVEYGREDHAPCLATIPETKPIASTAQPRPDV